MARWRPPSEVTPAPTRTGGPASPHCYLARRLSLMSHKSRKSTRLDRSAPSESGARASQPQTYPKAVRQAEADWDQVAKRTRESNYTVFLNANDPGATDKQLHEGWFEEALNRTKPTEGFRDIIEYLRYAPLRERMSYPYLS